MIQIFMEAVAKDFLVDMNRRRCKDFGDRVALVQGLGFRVPKV